MPQSRLAVGVTLAAAMLVSMALGGGVVAATYEARLGEQRDALLATFEQRVVIAKQQVALAERQLQDVQQRVDVGMESPEAVLDMQFKLKDAEAELKSIELDIAEIRATGRDPMHSLSAPLVSGRDFVAERWRVEMTVPVAALALERTRAAATQSRVDVGLANPIDVEAANLRVAESQAAIEVFERKLRIRQTYLKRGVPAKIAELQGLEAENKVRRATLTRRIESAQRQVHAMESKVEVGAANPIEVGEARLRLQGLQLEATKAEYELLLIRKQLGK